MHWTEARRDLLGPTASQKKIKSGVEITTNKCWGGGGIERNLTEKGEPGGEKYEKGREGTERSFKKGGLQKTGEKNASRSALGWGEKTGGRGKGTEGPAAWEAIAWGAKTRKNNNELIKDTKNEMGSLGGPHRAVNGSPEVRKAENLSITKRKNGDNKRGGPYLKKRGREIGVRKGTQGKTNYELKSMIGILGRLSKTPNEQPKVKGSASA